MDGLALPHNMLSAADSGKQSGSLILNLLQFLNWLQMQSCMKYNLEVTKAWITTVKSIFERKGLNYLARFRWGKGPLRPPVPPGKVRNSKVPLNR